MLRLDESDNGVKLYICQFKYNDCYDSIMKHLSRPVWKGYLNTIFVTIQCVV